MADLTAPAAHAAPRPVRAGVRLLLPLLGVVVLLAVVVGAAGVAGRWLLATEAGSLWLMQHLPFVQVQGWRGALLGNQWRAERLRAQWAGGQQWLVIDGLAADGLVWSWRPSRQAWIGLDAQSLAMRKLTLHTGPPSGQPFKLPERIAPPLQLTLAQASLDELAIDAQAPLRQLRVRGLVLDPRPGPGHHIDALSLEGWGLTIEGALAIGNAAPSALVAQATLRPTLSGDAPRWAAVLKAGGTLAQIDLGGTLRGVPVGGREAPALDLKASLRPAQAWPLVGLNLHTEGLDLAALAAQAPATRLAGTATLAGGTAGAPLVARIALQNALPGRWDEGRLPLRELTLEMSGDHQHPERVDITRFELALADTRGAAGTLRGSAVWNDHELALQTQLAGVTPQRLDGRAATMTLDGPVLATLRGLPSPDPAATGATPPPHIDWKIDLQGQLDKAPRPVRLTLQGSADDQRLEITRARAEAGAASAEMQASLVRSGRGPWQLKSNGRVLDFDPLPWWPGSAGTSWRAGPHRLSGDWKFALELPADAERLPPWALAQRIAGNGTLRVHDSVLAGVPLAADITLGYARSSGPAAGSLRAELNLGGNRLVVDGRGDPAGKGESDHWQAELDATTLTALAPLARLGPAGSDWVPRQGSATARLVADGRWPTLRSQGSAELSQLLVGTLGVARGTLNWGLDTHGDQPLSLKLELAGVALGKLRADHLRAELRGTVAAHHVDISGALPLVPPPLAEQVLGIQVQTGTQAQMQADGGWVADAAGGGRWRAHIDHLVVGSWDGSSGNAPPASGWAEAKDLRAEIQFDAQGDVVGVQAEPGRVDVAGAVALRWDAVRVDLRGEQPQIALHADIEPFALAPLLARAQPTMGWAGDLRLAARVDIRAAEKVDADLVFERRDGDLNVANGDGVQLLGITELRLALTAHDGLWVFAPVLRGRSLGDISGELQVRTTPERRWPDADAAISGAVQAEVADIGIWGAWVPPGWRLTGRVATSAGVSGRFGAPQYTGSVTGSGLGVRNLLQGVNVSDGDIAAKLEGDTAAIERFKLKGGDGSITVTGDATLGETPQARLKLAADHFRVLGRVDRTLIASGNAELLLQSDKIQLDGKLKVDEGLIDASRSDAPSLDDDVTVHRVSDVAARPVDPNAPKAQRNFALALDIDLGERLRLRGRGLDTSLRGQVHLATPAGQLAVTGTINTEGGTYAAYGQKLEIERGIVAFGGALDNPRLDVLALRPNIDTRVGVQITGTLLAPRVRLYSDPDLSDTDKLSWLVLGRAPDGLGRNDTALLQRAAVALLAGEGEAPTDALMKSLGIDDISLKQSDSDVHETVVSLGKQLSRRWYVGYERGVNSTAGTFQLIYRIANRFTLRAQSGLENALDVIWSWRFQPTPADAGMRKSTVIPP